MSAALIDSLRSLNQLLTAGIAITAFSLLLYALTFNLQDRVARSFALILVCVVIVFTADAIGSTTPSPETLTFWLQLEWIGITFLPPAYLHFSDALLAVTGQPSRGRRRLAVRLTYAASALFLAALPFNALVGPLIQNVDPAPHLQRTPLTWLFSAYFAAILVISGINLVRAYRRTVASVSRRRMGYLLAGSLAPALGSYPFLLFGSELASSHPLTFWLAATFSNVLVSGLLILMAYAVAFFGVPWPDRVVKRRLFKWLMRGPVTASTVLAITTLVRRMGETWGEAYTAAVPVVMAASLLILQHLITLAAPYWERWLFHGGERSTSERMQKLEERLLTSGDLHQFLEAVLAAVCDRLQSPSAFVVALGPERREMVVTVGEKRLLENGPLTPDVLEKAYQNGSGHNLFAWGDYWLAPLFARPEAGGDLVGLLGVLRLSDELPDEEQREALHLLARRAAIALEDRIAQERLFTSLEALTPQVELIQRLRAATRYDSGQSLAHTLTRDDAQLETETVSLWVKDALTHYWGGPKLTQSPLLRFQIVQRALDDYEGNPTNALRAILRQAIEQIRPEGERRFTGEWILYNILEMKFMEGRKVREVAMRLAMSEADLYRKQRVALEAIAEKIMEMEQNAALEEPRASLAPINPTQSNHMHSSLQPTSHSTAKGGLNGE